MNLTEKQIWECLYDIVRAHKTPDPEKPCLQFNGWAVVGDLSDLESGNLGKSSIYVEKNHFWSQGWEDKGFNSSAMEKQYPLLVADGLSDSYSTKFDSGCSPTDMMNLSLWAFDMPPNCGYHCGEDEETYCNTRTWEEIICDLKKMLKQVIGQMLSKGFRIKDGRIDWKWIYDFGTDCLVGVRADFTPCYDAGCDTGVFVYDQPVPIAVGDNGCYSDGSTELKYKEVVAPVVDNRSEFDKHLGNKM